MNYTKTDNFGGSSFIMSKSKPPIFILGCQRSGTSLLRRLLDSHSNIACPPESGFLVQLSRVIEIERSRECLETMGFSKEEVLKQMRIFTEHFFSKYAQSKGKRRWADKTPHYLNHTDTIEKMFKSDVMYVGIVRHGLDVAHSLSQFNWGILDPYLTSGQTNRKIAAIRFWKDQNTKLLVAYKKFSNRFILIKYEDLTSNPKNTLQRIFKFINEPWEDNILNYNSFIHDTGFEDPKIDEFDKIEVNTDNYQSWPIELQEKAFHEVKKMMMTFGYTLGYNQH